MEDKSILTVGSETQKEVTEPTEQYLQINKSLSEFNDQEIEAARRNLNVPSIEDVLTPDQITQAILNEINKHTNDDNDPHGSNAYTDSEIAKAIENVARINQDNKFTVPQTGVAPINKNHYTTKEFVENLLSKHTTAEDPHNILERVSDILFDYVQKEEFNERVKNSYTKEDINDLLSKYIKSDGSTPFTKPQITVDPISDKHAANKGYVDKTISSSLENYVNTHDFLTTLNNRLAKYIKKENVYDKTQTYSRTQIDSIIQDIVESYVNSSISDYTDSVNSNLDDIRKNYLRKDSPFTKPQKGVDAVNDNELVTLKQLKENIEAILIPESIDRNDFMWITSGPVEAEVGHVKEGDILAEKVSLQDIMDAIFYGKRTKLTVPELATLGESFPITLCIQGSLASVEYAEIYQNDELLKIITKAELEESNCITINSNVIKEDSEIIAKVFYNNGSSHELSNSVKVSMPIFVGIIEKWQFGNTLTYDQLISLWQTDPENNRFYNKGKNLQSLEHSFNFDEETEQKIIVALPANYSDLKEMTNSAQSVTIDGFNVIDQIPFDVPGSDTDIIYKIYCYKQGLYSLNTNINFKFG